MHICGNLKDALELARTAQKVLPKKSEYLDEVEMHIIEVYLQIVTFASQASSWLQLEDTQPPWTDPVSEPPWEGFRKLCTDLKSQGRLWESQKIMRLLLFVLPSDSALQLCEELVGRIDTGDDHVVPLSRNTDAGEDLESTLFAQLSTLNACTQYLVNQEDESSHSVTPSKAVQWSSLSQSMLDWVQATEPEEPRGRQFFEWKLTNLDINRRSGLSEKVAMTKEYEEAIAAARQVSDLSAHAGYLWALHRLNPDSHQLEILHELQVDTMGDSLGYTEHLDKSLQVYLQQHRDEGSQISIPEVYLTTSPVQLKTFNAPNLVEKHLQNQFKLGQLRKDDAQIELARRELQILHASSSSRRPPLQSEARPFIPLHWAVKCNNMASVESYINGMEPINEKAADGSTALHYAVERSKSLAIATLLLEHGAGPNVQRFTDGYTPLHVLVSTSYRRDSDALAILNKLISYKADIYAMADDGQSVVGLAACQNLATPIQRLIEEGADPNSTFRGYSKEAADPNSMFTGPRSALNIAAWHAHIETMRVLIDAGADVNNNEFGQTPLLEIVCCRGASTDLNRYVEGAKMLLDAKADVNASAWGYSVMSRAVGNGNLDLVKMLLRRDPRPRTINKNLLTLALEEGHEHIAKYLQDNVNLAMPITIYGVCKAKPIAYKYETEQDNPVSPHLSLVFSNGEFCSGRAVINIKSGDHSDSRLVYWLVQNLQHPIVDQLQKLDTGFYPLQDSDEQRFGGLALDYIRGNLFQKQSGKLLSHDILEEKNDIIDALKPVLDEAISRETTIYLYGSHFNDGMGIHNVHMNQGSPGRWQGDNGVWQDGGVILQFMDHWEAVFIGFASQAVHTKDGSPGAGNPIPQTGYKTWANFLDLEVPDEQREDDDLADMPIIISHVLVSPHGPNNHPDSESGTVALTNRTPQPVDLTGWKIRNAVGQVQELPRGASLSARELSKAFKVSNNCPLSNQGGVITLLNAQGLKVHGVSYTKAQAKQEGGMVSFDL